MVRNRSAQTLVKIKIFYKYKILIISVKKNKFIKNKKQIPNFLGNVKWGNPDPCIILTVLVFCKFLGKGLML